MMCNYCEENKLCYYHQKIKDGLIDSPKETGEITAKMQSVWEYMPLVQVQATFLSEFCSLGYEDLCQQGYLALAEIALKIEWEEMSPKQVSSYIKSSVVGLMRNYIAKHDKVVALPAFNIRYFDTEITTKGLDGEDQLYSDAPSAEERLLRVEALEVAHARVGELIEGFNERESYVLWNHIVTDDPTTMRDIADQFETSKDSILRDVKRIRSQLRLEEVDEL
jgi:RNA polymerase sigma factor (sigma-70 family)